MTGRLRTMITVAVCLLLTQMTPVRQAHANQTILKPEQAFRYTVSSADGALFVDWTIEAGHYLYKERMSFATETPGMALGEAELPPGKKYTDEFFGEMHIYRGKARVRIPIARQPAGGGPVNLIIRSQGCADIGLCYPPQTWSAAVELPATSKMSRLLGTDDRRNRPGDPLPPAQAFQPLITVFDPFTLHVDFMIAEGYYLYRDSITVNIAAGAKPGTAATGTPQLPSGTMQ